MRIFDALERRIAADPAEQSPPFPPRYLPSSIGRSMYISWTAATGRTRESGFYPNGTCDEFTLHPAGRYWRIA